MEFEFDKEMDAILRRARRGVEAVASFDSHPDADEISAFAENALPDAARARFAPHLADCARCRKILSNVILLNSEAETQTASSAVSAKTAATGAPWYRRLFAFPQMAYAMGAIVLLFSGFFGYLILQNLSSGVSDVASRSEKPAQTDKSAPTVSQSSNAAANSSAPAANSSAPMNAPAPASSPMISVSNTAPEAATPANERNAALPEPNIPADAKTYATPEAKPQIAGGENDEKELAKIVPPAPTTQPNAAGASREETRRDKDDLSSKAEKNIEDSPESKLKSNRSEPQTPKKKAAKPGETRSVGGKTFNNVGGIWFDSAYNKQKTINVRRGSDDYRKLDAGLRSIADELGGTVVVLWSGKAYRIQ